MSDTQKMITVTDTPAFVRAALELARAIYGPMYTNAQALAVSGMLYNALEIISPDDADGALLAGNLEYGFDLACTALEEYMS